VFLLTFDPLVFFWNPRCSPRSVRQRSREHAPRNWRRNNDATTPRFCPRRPDHFVGSLHTNPDPDSAPSAFAASNANASCTNPSLATYNTDATRAHTTCTNTARTNTARTNSARTNSASPERIV
jgi:hypothetical protein